MSSAATKERQYAQLAAKMSRFSAELKNTHMQSARLKDSIVAMHTLAGLHASQFAAVARIVDIEQELWEERQAKEDRGDSK